MKTLYRYLVILKPLFFVSRPHWQAILILGFLVYVASPANIVAFRAGQVIYFFFTAEMAGSLFYLILLDFTAADHAWYGHIKLNLQ